MNTLIGLTTVVVPLKNCLHALHCCLFVSILVLGAGTVTKYTFNSDIKKCKKCFVSMDLEFNAPNRM